MAKTSTTKGSTADGKKDKDAMRASSPAQGKRTAGDRSDRGPDGRFVKGHPRIGGPECATRRRVTSASLRRAMLNSLQPLLDNIAADIAAIETPGDRVMALARILPYLVPRYHTTTATEEDARRDVTTEEFIRHLDEQYTEEDTDIDANTLHIVDNK